MTAPTHVVTWRRESPGVWVVTLDRPPANALGVPILDGLHAAIDAAERAGDVKVMILTSALDGFFAAGADIKHMSSIDAKSFNAYGDKMRAVNDRLAASPWTSIAAVDGLALGGGLELALCADFRVAGENARFGVPEILLGVIPGLGGTQRLPRLIGPARAKNLIYTGRFVDAEEALRIGLVDQVVPDADVYGAATRLAGQFVSGPALALRAAKEAIDTGLDLGLDAGLEVERLHFAALFATEDQKLGMESFVASGPGHAKFVGK